MPILRARNWRAPATSPTSNSFPAWRWSRRAPKRSLPTTGWPRRASSAASSPGSRNWRRPSSVCARSAAP
jgi:hypothetical protein